MTEKERNEFYEQLSELSGEEVLQAFTDWHGMQLLTDEFRDNCIEEGYIEE